MPGFSAAARSTEPEWMDTETVPYEDFRACLADLEMVNRLSFGYRPTIAFLERLRREGRLPAGRPVRILDAGSGYGDTLRAVAAWGERAGVPLALAGVDLNPWSTRAALEASPGLPVDWITADVFDCAGRLAAPPDVVISALFVHHLDDGQVVAFLRWMEETAATGWFVNDLHRHAVSYAGFAAIARLARWHRFVRHDGPVSIARGFVRADWERFAAAAGLAGSVSVDWWTPFRLCVSRVKP